MQVIANSAAALVAHRGLVLYAQGDAGIRHATVHDIHVDTEGNPALQPGVSLAEEVLHDMLNTLVGTSALVYRPDNILAASRETIVWWSRPALRTLFVKPVADVNIDYSELPTLRLNVPVPGLIFTLKSRSLMVAGVTGNTRPVPSTKLYRSPFANTYDDGNVCMGDVKLGSGPVEVERQFFDSVFTHDVGNVARVNGARFTWQAWQALDDDKSRHDYPVERLISTNITLEGFLKRGAAL
ncbi:MAG: PRTRC system protein B [Betaproteobacteria bacterium]